MESIPKIIHYCWFGRGEKSEFIKKCINSWKKFLPNYEIKEWNEDNFDITSNEYVYEAYKNKKYAFVSDYVRLKVLYEHGGIYFDTDIEVIKNFDNLINNRDIYCFEMDNQIMTGVMISKINSPLILEYLNHYNDLKFKEENGNLNLQPNTIYFTELLKSKGLNLDNKKQLLEGYIEVYPNEYFCAYDMKNSNFNVTENTFTIHHYKGSWISGKEKVKREFKRFISKILGKNLYEKIRLAKKNIFKD